ncbi:hypothetical protein OXX79_007297 [Metschnikowia pulcherrima]
MATSTKSIQAQLAKAAVYIEQLDELLEERERLVSVLHLTPSNADNLDIINLLAKTKAGLEYAQGDLASGISKELSRELFQTANSYNEKISQLANDPYINVDEYQFHALETSENESNGPKKSVRFKDFDAEESADDSTQMRNQLMGTQGQFRPYTDDFEETEDRNTLSSVDTSNEELFASHQQQMVQQDAHLEALHASIRTQHSMGVNIHDELDEHLILLNDLESGVDGSHTRVRRATRGIASFRRKVRENGSLATIVVLTVILILLLVVLN